MRVQLLRVVSQPLARSIIGLAPPAFDPLESPRVEGLNAEQAKVRWKSHGLAGLGESRQHVRG